MPEWRANGLETAHSAHASCPCEGAEGKGKGWEVGTYPSVTLYANEGRSPCAIHSNVLFLDAIYTCGKGSCVNTTELG